MRPVKICLVLILVVGIIFIYNSKLYADDTSEVILKLLIKKGIITQREIDEIKSEMAKEEVLVPAPLALEERVDKLEKAVPSWVKNLKLKGDLRLRNEYIEDDPGQDNNRQRIRFRVGVEAKVNDQVGLGFGLATGSTQTPTSTNQTLGDTFDSKHIWLDYAYISYEPYDWLNLIGGKFKSPFFHTDMLWDSDIRFDGFDATLSHKLNPDGAIPTSVFLTGGYFPIEDNNVADGDVYLLIGQIGSESELADGYAKLKTGLAYYDFENLKGATAASLDFERSTNTYRGGILVNGYKVISPTVKLSFKDLFGALDVPWGILSDYAYNFDPSSGNSAWRAGFWLGKSKVKKMGQWKLLSQYSHLERDAFFDAFPDADFNNGGTNGKGWELIFDYGLMDNAIFSIDYYNTESISGPKTEEQRVQTDLIFKF